MYIYLNIIFNNYYFLIYFILYKYIYIIYIQFFNRLRTNYTLISYYLPVRAYEVTIVGIPTKRVGHFWFQ